MKLHDFTKIVQMVIIVLITFSGRTGFGIKFTLFPMYIGLAGIITLIISLMILRKKVFVISNPLYMFLLLLFSIILLLGNYINVNDYGYTKSIEFSVYIFFLILIIDNCVEERKDLINLIKSFYFVAILMAIISISMGVINNTLLTNRLTFLDSGANTFSRMMFMGLAANLFLIFYSKRNYMKYFSLWVFLVAIFFSGARQTILGTIILTILFLLLIITKRENVKIKSTAKYLTLLSILILPFIILWPFIQGNRFYQRFILLFSDDKGDSFNTRTWLIEQAFRYGRESYLFGNGTGTFSIEIPEYIYPHNIFAEIFMENGILGLIVLIIIIIYPLKSVVKRVDSRNEFIMLLVSYTLLVMYLFGLFTAQISGDLFDNRWLFIFGFLILKKEALIRREYFEENNTNVRLK